MRLIEDDALLALANGNIFDENAENGYLRNTIDTSKFDCDVKDEQMNIDLIDAKANESANDLGVEADKCNAKSTAEDTLKSIAEDADNGTIENRLHLNTTAETDGEGVVKDCAQTDDGEGLMNDCQAEQTQKEQNELLAGKFKNVESLEQAYSALEKEFTKRSQRLKELEAKTTDTAKQGTNAKAEAQAQFDPERWRANVDDFFASKPEAQDYAEDMARFISENPDVKGRKDCLEYSLKSVLASKYRRPDEIAKDTTFINDYVLDNEDVKKAVIARYLSEVKSGMPPRIISGAGQAGIAPSSRPRSIADAGNMFLKNNR